MIWRMDAAAWLMHAVTRGMQRVSTWWSCRTSSDTTTPTELPSVSTTTPPGSPRLITGRGSSCSWTRSLSWRTCGWSPPGRPSSGWGMRWLSWWLILTLHWFQGSNTTQQDQWFQTFQLWLQGSVSWPNILYHSASTCDHWAWYCSLYSWLS